MKIENPFKKLIFFCSIVLLLFVTKPLLAIEDPILMLQSVTGRVTRALRMHRQEIQRHPQKLYILVDDLILPYVDFSEMAKWVVGRNAWKAADAETKREFIEAFKTMVVRSYAHSLLEYTDQTIEFLPLREAPENKERIRVSSVIKDKGKPPLRMDYHLLRTNESWRVYDIIVEGVSLMQGYRAQFADDVRVGGVKKVVETLHRRNGTRH